MRKIAPQAQPPIDTEQLKITKPQSFIGGFSEWWKGKGYVFQQQTCKNHKLEPQAPESTIARSLFEQLSLVQLAKKSDYWLQHQGRLSQPLFKDKEADHYKPISWEQALQLVATNLTSLESPNQAAFYSGGQLSNESAFIFQLFARAFGTNNISSFAQTCHQATHIALQQSLGAKAPNASLEDFPKADLLIIIGHNPTNNPCTLAAIKKAKENGTKILAINPIKEAGIHEIKPKSFWGGLFGKAKPITDLFLQPWANGDLALIKAIMSMMLEAEKEQGNVFNHEFIQLRTTCYQEFIDDLKEHYPDDLAGESGIPESDVRRAAGMIMAANKIVIAYGMGITQHKNATHTIQELANLLLLKGSIGKGEGGQGLCALGGGTTNILGEQTMGVSPNIDPQWINPIENKIGICIPESKGLTTIQTIRAMAEGNIKTFFSIRGNLLSASPDTEFAASAIRRCNLSIHIDTHLHRGHLVTAKQSLILPCAGLEDASAAECLSRERSGGIIESFNPIYLPLTSNIPSCYKLIGQIAQKVLGTDSSVEWEHISKDPDEIRSLISQVIEGFESYNIAIRGDSPMYTLPRTAVRKGTFLITHISIRKRRDDQFRMMCMSAFAQSATIIHDLKDPYRGISRGRRAVFINPKDIARLQLKEGQLVNLHSHNGGTERIAQSFKIVPFEVPTRCLAIYFPEGNVLMSIDDIGKQGEIPFKGITVQIKPQ